MDFVWKLYGNTYAVHQGSSIILAHVPQEICRWGPKCHKVPRRYIFLIIFFVSEHLSSATKNDAKCHMWHLCRYLRNPAVHVTVALVGVATLERMRTAVREAFSYGIRHVIRHVHWDSVSYDQIRVRPWETIPRIIPRIPQYGVWYSAECMHWNSKKSVVNHFKNRLKLW